MGLRHKFSFWTPPGGTELLCVELRFIVCRKNDSSKSPLSALLWLAVSGLNWHRTDRSALARFSVSIGSVVVVIVVVAMVTGELGREGAGGRTRAGALLGLGARVAVAASRARGGRTRVGRVVPLGGRFKAWRAAAVSVERRSVVAVVAWRWRIPAMYRFYIEKVKL